ncbi:MAG: molecular chaperone Tir [Candidatus Methanofastidiosa archaeon]|nr:molecular chaperone Tir [Candidatus Methanofastidiosa archaeon]
MVNEYNLFISHSWTYSDAYENLTSMLNSRPYFKYRNYSVPRNDPIHTRGTDRQLYDAIKNQIRFCHAILIMGGVYSSYSKWIQKEIKIAKNEFCSPKPIIGIKPWAQTNMSSLVQANADKIVGWNTDSIVDAIRALVR